MPSPSEKLLEEQRLYQQAEELFFRGQYARARLLFARLVRMRGEYATSAGEYLRRIDARPPDKTKKKMKKGAVKTAKRATVGKPVEVYRGDWGGAGAAPRVVTTVTDELVRRTPHLDLIPDRPLAPEMTIVVEVYTDEEPAKSGERSLPVVARFPPGINTLNVAVRLATTGHFIVDGPAIKKLVLERKVARSKTVQFNVRARAAPALAQIEGPAIIAAYFTHNGRASGMVERVLSVGSPADKPRGGPANRRQPVASLGLDAEAVQADLTVEILDPTRGGQHLLVTVFSPHLPELRDGVAGEWPLPGKTSELVGRYLGKFVAEKGTPRDTLFELVGAGKQLFEASPPVFQEAFWALIDAGRQIQTIYVVSEEPYVPWELMIPTRLLPGGKREQWDVPLGVRCSVGRWIPKEFLSPRQRVPISNGHVIAPVYEGGHLLKNSEKEAQLIRDRFAGMSRITPATGNAINDSMGKGGGSLLHFVGHGLADAEGLVLELEGEGDLLSSTRLRGMTGVSDACEEHKPFVFLNACDGGRTEIALIGVGGLAPEFLRIGASAVLAPLWEVKDVVAHQVALDIYESASSSPRTPYAEVVRLARARSYKEPWEDSWAAYCFYGDPLAAPM